MSSSKLYSRDYLFGNRDRIANCFTLDGHFLISRHGVQPNFDTAERQLW